eukprot:TRINITY_DN6566_c0_g2_i1.p1 TRINITY_DN6566_c0_g2~~TRINITY_DN6566_c0_g2_i1.p1  ORF type:complete len:211 (-),score=5.18 TRINITY_DN6566_c0_g2_i1:310-942(-)
MFHTLFNPFSFLKPPNRLKYFRQVQIEHKFKHRSISQIQFGNRNSIISTIGSYCKAQGCGNGGNNIRNKYIVGEFDRGGPLVLLIILALFQQRSVGATSQPGKQDESKQVAIVIPVLNEVGCIDELLRQVQMLDPPPQPNHYCRWRQYGRYAQNFIEIEKCKINQITERKITAAQCGSICNISRVYMFFTCGYGTAIGFSSCCSIGIWPR